MVISVENHKIFQPLVFCTPTEGVPLGIGYRHWGSKTRMMDLPANKEVWWYLQPSG